MKVLLTGATGFVGRQVLANLAGRGVDVHAVARRPRAMDEATWHAADLLRPGAAAELIGAVRPTHLLHLAWYGEPGKFWQARENLRWVSASVELLEAFADSGGRRFVGAGSCAEYDWAGGVLDERTTRLRPATLYGAAKLAVGDLARTLAASAGFSCAWARLFFMYGPHEPRTKIVASVITSLLGGRTAECTSGEQRRDFMHVADVADALATMLCSEVEGAVNVGTGEAVAVRDVAREIGELVGAPERVAIGARPTPSPEAPLVVADASRLSDELKWMPRLSRRDGLAQTIDWWRSELAR